MADAALLVTGATGFIGRSLCPRLAADGWQILGLSRTPERARRLWPTYTWLGGLNELDRLGPVAGIVNLAGAPLADRRWTERRRREFYDSRVALTEQLFEHFAARSAPRVLVNGSAVGFYGPRGDEPLDEGAEPGAGFAAELCRAWESMACQFENLGTRVVRLRLGVVLGREGGLLGRLVPLFRLGLGGPVGSGCQWLSWIHLEDLVEIVRLGLADEGLSGAVNATAPAPVTNRDFARALGRALRRPALLPAPAPLLRLAFGQMADELLLAGQRVVPKRLLERGFSFRYPDLSAALAAIFASGT